MIGELIQVLWQAPTNPTLMRLEEEEEDEFENSLPLQGDVNSKFKIKFNFQSNVLPTITLKSKIRFIRPFKYV